MKKHFLFLLVAIFCSVSLFAQVADPATTIIPNDPNMRIGKLDNGMTYYIQSNNKPKNAASFYIIHNVGAVQELEEAQNGLAHFLEHMAFNGTKNFPNKTMLDYLQKNGMAFGRNINASTGMDVTQYFISDVPTNKSEGLIDTVLLVINDWSHYISLKHEEIDNERGVISEELRTGTNAEREILEKRLTIAGNGTMYSKRNVIGTLDNLKNFKYSDIENFYNTWYHPALQAVVVVGDFNADEMEAKVKSLFSKIPKKENAIAKDKNAIPDFTETIAEIYSHEQLTATDFWMLMPIEENFIDKNNQYSTEIKSYMTGLISSVLGERMREIQQKPNAPFFSAQMGLQDIFASTKHLFVMAQLKDDRMAEGIEAITTEINRIKKYGVNPGELDRAVQSLIKMNETSYQNRNDRLNGAIANMAIYNFTKNSPIISPEMDYQIAMSILKNINTDIVNQYIGVVFKDKNAYISISTPDKYKNNIDEKGLLVAYEKGLTKKVEPIVEKVIDKNLLNKDAITPGMAVTQTEDMFGSRMWIMSNGAVVIFKKTDYKKDEILFQSSRKGGVSLIDDKDYIGASLMQQYLTSGLGGVDKYSSDDLRKVLSGKQASVRYNIGSYFNGFNGGGSSTDLETLFQMIHLYYSQPRFDAQAIELFKTRFIDVFKNMKSDPQMTFSENVEVAGDVNKNRPNSISLLLENIDKLTPETAKEYYDQIYNGVKGMKFIFVGNAEYDAVKAFAEKYIATLNPGEDEKWINRHGVPKSNVEKSFIFPQKDDKATVYINLRGAGLSLNEKNLLNISTLADILRLRYTKIVREEMGATYGVSNNASIVNAPKALFSVVARYDTNDKFVNSTSKVITDQIADIAKNGPTKEELNIVLSNRIKQYHNNQIQNGYWMNVLNNLYVNGFDNHNNMITIMEKLSVSDIKKTAETVLKNKKELKVIMSSAEIK